MSQTQESDPERETEQVLEFRLGAETYAISIDYIEEIAHVGDLTTIPNAPAHVTGVMDLRGRTTAVIDPKCLFEIDDDEEATRILVFDPERLPDGQAIGWAVDDVHQVVTVSPDEADDAPGVHHDAIRGVIKRDGRFVIWVDPDGFES